MSDTTRTPFWGTRDDRLSAHRITVSVLKRAGPCSTLYPFSTNTVSDPGQIAAYTDGALDAMR